MRRPLQLVLKENIRGLPHIRQELRKGRGGGGAGDRGQGGMGGDQLYLNKKLSYCSCS